MLIKLIDLLRRFKSLFVSFLISIFGHWHWQQPNWLIRLGTSIGKLYQAGKAKPLVSLGIFVLLCGVTTASWYGYQWWQNRPQPVRIDFTVTEPERTAIEKEEKPHPLVISFNASVAPLDQVGKSISQGIQMQPEIVGEWFWVDDKTLQFTPSNDWPINQTHNVILAKTLTAEQALLARQKFAFATPIFTVELTKSEFFQDVVALL